MRGDGGSMFARFHLSKGSLGRAGARGVGNKVLWCAGFNVGIET